MKFFYISGLNALLSKFNEDILQSRIEKQKVILLKWFLLSKFLLCHAVSTIHADSSANYNMCGNMFLGGK